MKNLANKLVELQRLIDGFSGAASMKSIDGRYFYVNQAWLTMTGLKRDEVIGKTDENFLDPDRYKWLKQNDREALVRDHPVSYRSESVIRDKKLDYIAYKWVIRGSDGSPFCICTVGVLTGDEEKVLELHTNMLSFLEQKGPK